MPQPNSPAQIVSTPAAPGQPYNPADEDNTTVPWVKLDQNAGPVNWNGKVTGGFADSPPWVQV